MKEKNCNRGEVEKFPTSAYVISSVILAVVALHNEAFEP